MRKEDTLFWVWLAEAVGSANADFRRLMYLYETPYNLFHADSAEIERIDGVSPRTIKGVLQKDLRRPTQILSDCDRLGIRILTYQEQSIYPKLLMDIKAPPIVLYYTGELPRFDSILSVGMVGTRRMSEYGMQAAYRIAYELASAGVTVVSGMAEGIDGVSAAGAIRAGGKTVAVLGCGINVAYPSHHAPLMQRIRETGTLISEYPPSTRPYPYHFPLRNRLISAFSRGTFVVEAGLGSGSLLTAAEAIRQSKEVFALPANLGLRDAEGTNGLLRDGARMVTCAADILRRFQLTCPEAPQGELPRDIEKKSAPDLPFLREMGVIDYKKGRGSVSVQQPPRIHAAPAARSATPKRPQAGPPRESALPSERVADNPKETPKKKTPDEVVSSLSPVQLAILEAMPDDRAITADSLGSLGFPYGDVVAALTMLEILGLIQKLPGALYSKT